MAPVEEVRVCRFCGHIDPAQHTGKCESCGSFTGFVICSHQEAETLRRERQRSRGRRGLQYALLGLVLLAGMTAWIMYVIFDQGIDPPPATTRMSASVEPHTWAQVRRTPQNSGFTSDTAPYPQRIAWTYRTDKRLLASPAVVENHVYLTTEDGRTVALDRQTGQPVWAYPNGGPSSSTPAVAGNHLIVAMRTGRVVALERHTGERLWQADFEKSILASPVVVDGTVYLGVGDWRLYALDAATGQQRWALATNDWVVSAVAYADNRIIVSSQKSRIQVVDTDSGRERFLYDTGLGRHIVASVAIQGDRAYFGSRYGRVWAIDWRTNRYPMERALLLWKTNLFAWGLLAKPPVHKGTVWSKPVEGDVTHTAAIAHQTIYVTTSLGAVVALDAATGAQRWMTKLDHDLTSAPVIAGDAVLIGTRAGIVIGLHAHTGAVLWRFRTEGEISASPIVTGDTMYVASHDGVLYAVTSLE
ncbi:outer membrane protein assembly factor BamB family protein [Candidatus Entotheonella palauensis]|uniref:outer membrane protein assembly factor BamB family protein n=1 Tax=Candidatus Entotheonella palauensis TaxID=93172 RepID=UPI000B7D3E0A|nr:PQQ-binding-like beta-propeller repeat protein [Candidatus Entotheonella palauensis]